MSRSNVWGFSVGIALIGLGLLFMLGQFIHVNLMAYLWPLFILAAGGLFFLGMITGGRSMGALAVPGSVITAVGLILFVQNLFGIWATWAYAWALIIAAVGIGLMIFGRWSSLPELSRAGRIVLGIGLVLFFIFGFLFEISASLLGMRSLGGIFWALALIVVGVYVMFGRTFFSRLGGPMGRSEVSLSTAQTAQSGEAYSPPAMVETGASSAAQVYPAPAGDVSAAVSGVRKVLYRALGDITVVQGEREGLEIEAPDLIRERIRSEVRGDTLEIRYEQDWLDWLNPRYWNLSPIHYTLYVQNLDYIDAAGLGNMIIPSLKTGQITVKHSGTGNVTMHNLAAETLRVDQSGLGNVAIDGQVNRQDVDLSGTGSYQASRLDCLSAAVRLSGLGSAVVLVRETLDARVSGVGSIEYYGSPRLTQQGSGVGSVRRVG